MSLVEVRVDELEDHPINVDIYGAEEDQHDWEEFVASIKRHGVMKPIAIDSDGMIISGHRRVKASKELGYEMIKANRFDFKNEGDKISYLLEENRYRPKTTAMRIREGLVYAANIQAQAKANMEHSDTATHTSIVTREALGKAAGMSGSTFEKGKKVVEEIDRLKEEGKEEEAQELEEKLNGSVHGAYKETVPEKPASKPPPKKPVDPDFWYQEDLERLIKSMEAVASKLAKKRKSTTPAALSWFFNTIVEDAVKYSSWLKGKLHDCPTCSGTMHLPSGDDCRNCISGKVGHYQIPEADIPESDSVIEVDFNQGEEVLD